MPEENIERTLGRILAGVEGIEGRLERMDMKHDALDRLHARMQEQIDDLKLEVAVVKSKAGAIATTVGLITSAIAWVAQHFFLSR